MPKGKISSSSAGIGRRLAAELERRNAEGVETRGDFGISIAVDGVRCGTVSSLSCSEIGESGPSWDGLWRR